MNEMKPEMITVISVVQGEAPQVQTIENNPQVFEAVIGHSVQTIHPFVDAVALARDVAAGILVENPEATPLIYIGGSTYVVSEAVSYIK